MAKASLVAGLALLLALGAGPAPAQDPEFEAKLDKLIETLKNGGEAERADAAFQIGYEHRRAARAVPALMAAVSDPAREVRLQSLMALSDFGEAARPAIPLLLRVIGEQMPAPEAYTAVSTLCLLAKEVPEAAAAYLGLLEHPAETVRMCAAASLVGSELDPDVAIPRLIAYVERSDAGFRHSAVQALGRFGPKAAAAAPCMIRCLEGTDELFLRESAAFALAAIGPGAKEALPALRRAAGSGRIDLRAPALYALWRIEGAGAEAAAESLAELLRSRTWLDSDCFEALGTMGGAGVRAAPAILLRFRDDDKVTRTQAIAALGRIAGDQKAVLDAMEKGIADVSDMVRRETCASLGLLGREWEAALPLLVKATGDADESVGRAALAALGALGPKAAPVLPDLLPLLRQISLSHEAIKAIAAMGTPAAAAALADSLSGRSFATSWVIEALAAMGPAAKVALPALGRLALDERQHGPDREAAAAAILEIRAALDKRW